MSRLLLRISLLVPLLAATEAVLPLDAWAQATTPAKPAATSPSPTKSQAEPREETEEDRQALQAVQETFGKSVVELEQQYEGKLAEAPEAVRMLIDISRGAQMLPGEGWFGPAKSKYSLDWLLAQHQAEKGKPLAADDFRGLPHWLARIDRNKDGMVLPKTSTGRTAVRGCSGPTW